MINRLNNSSFQTLILGSDALVGSDDASQVRPIIAKKSAPSTIDSLNRDLTDGLRFDLINYIRSGNPLMKRSLIFLAKRFKTMFGANLKEVSKEFKSAKREIVSRSLLSEDLSTCKSLTTLSLTKLVNTL